MESSPVQAPTFMATRWGICATGNICNDFVLSIKHLSPSGRSNVAAAVAARSEEDAKKFAETHSIPKFYGDYEKLAQDPDIDIVYVGTIHLYHYRVVKMFLEHRKAVLCEKPMTMCVKHTKALVELARKKKVFLMEAICTPFRPFYEDMLAGLDYIGPIQHMIIPFGSAGLQNVNRVVDFELGGSLILDCTIYSLNLAMDVFKMKPKKLIAVGNLNEQGVDINSTIILQFGDGAICTMISSATCAIPKAIQIVGSTGSVELITGGGGSMNVRVCGIPKAYTPAPRIGPYKYHPWLGSEIAHVRECLLQGLKESPIVPLKRSIRLAEMMEDAINQIGGKVHIVE